MSQWLWWKCTVVAVLLRIASGWAYLFRRRLKGAALGKGTYNEARASERFGFVGPFDYETVHTLPFRERYSWRIAVPKLLVNTALAIPLNDGRKRRLLALSDLDQLYDLLGRPKMRSLGGGDGLFGALRVLGPNPIWIRRQRPDDLPSGDGFIVDYRPLLRDLPSHEGRWLAPCAAVFDLDLRPTGIELVVDGHSERFTPNDGLHWDLAKLFFQSADLLVHETVSHLSWTHLHAESIALLAARTLPLGHPMRELLSPSFAFTLKANSHWGRAWFGEGRIFDRVVAPGWAGASLLLSRASECWHFSKMIPPQDASDRGMDALINYPWRDDATLLWSALRARTQRAIVRSWPDSAAIQNDPALGVFLAGLVERFGARGWPVGRDIETLVTITSAILFLPVSHTLLNAQQYAMFGYPPAWPTSLCVPPPVRGRELPANVLQDALPDLSQMLDTIRTTYASSIQFNQLGSDADDLLLRDDLSRIDRIVAERDLSRRWSYDVARPEAVSASINA